LLTYGNNIIFIFYLCLSQYHLHSIFIHQSQLFFNINICFEINATNFFFWLNNAINFQPMNSTPLVLWIP